MSRPRRGRPPGRPRPGDRLVADHVPEQLAQAYADELADLDAALKLWRYTEQQLPTPTGSRNLLAFQCPCGRRLRVAKATLVQAPIVCGACAEPFEPL